MNTPSKNEIVKGTEVGEEREAENPPGNFDIF